jgi:hypothetical protein
MAWPMASRHRNAAPFRTFSEQRISISVFKNVHGVKLTLCIGREGRQEPVHIRLGQGSCSLHEEIRQERGSEKAVVPVDGAWVVAIKSSLHNDGPDVHPNVEDYNSIETDLGAATLCEFLGIENEA